MQKIPIQNHPFSPGLKTLIQEHEDEEEKSHVTHSYMISSHSSSKSLKSITFLSLTKSSSYDLSSSSISDDMLGTESGCCLGLDFDQEPRIEINPSPFWRRNQRRSGTKKKYPPPIPLLARRGNLPGYRPWSLTRRYVDGRLILTEERVKYHEYFEACRENGRLILNLGEAHRNGEEEAEAEEEEELELQELELIQEEEEEDDDDDDDDNEFILPEKPPAVASLESYFSCNVNAHRNGDGFMSSTPSSAIPPMTAVV